MSNRFNMTDDENDKTVNIQIKINLNNKPKYQKNKKNYQQNNYQHNKQNNYHQNKQQNNYHQNKQQNNYNNNNNYHNNYNNNDYRNKKVSNRFGNNNNQKNNYHNNRQNNNNNNYRQNNNNYRKNDNRQNNNYRKNNKKSKKHYQQPKHPQYNNYENDILNTHWTIHIHNISETDWTLESYKKVFVIKKITDFWTFFNNFTDFQKFNFYIMRGDIKPVYEDKNNTNGYSYSYIIPGRKVNQTFIHCLAEMLCENLVDIKNYNEVCGVSLVPKPNGISIFKVWMRNKTNVLKLKIVDDNLINGRYQDHKLY